MSSDSPESPIPESPPSPSVCPVCRDPPVDPLTTSCRHTFCRTCLQSWIQQSMETGNEVTCPVCRAVIARPVSLPLPQPLSLGSIPPVLSINLHIDNITVNINTRTNNNENMPKAYTTALLIFGLLGLMSFVQALQTFSPK